jgi:hypothetical protein
MAPPRIATINAVLIANAALFVRREQAGDVSVTELRELIS